MTFKTFINLNNSKKKTLKLPLKSENLNDMV